MPNRHGDAETRRPAPAPATETEAITTHQDVPNPIGSRPVSKGR